MFSFVCFFTFVSGPFSSGSISAPHPSLGPLEFSFNVTKKKNKNFYVLTKQDDFRINDRQICVLGFVDENLSYLLCASIKTFCVESSINLVDRQKRLTFY